MISVRCLRSVASLTRAPSLRSRTSTRWATSRRCSKSRATRARAVRSCDRRTSSSTCEKSSCLLAEPAMGDLEAPHGWPALFSVGRGGGTVFAFELGEIGARRTELLIQSTALGIGDGAGRVLRLDPVIDERIEQELFSHVLEEVLLSPALEHAVGDLDVAQVASTRDY